MNDARRILVVVLVVLAGCAGPNGGETPGEPTATLASTWTETEETSTDTILRVHRAALANRSYTLERSGPSIRNATATITSDGYHLRRNGSVRELARNGTRYRHLTTDTEVRTLVTPVHAHPPRWIDRTLSRGRNVTIETNGTLTRDGRPLRVYRSLGTNGFEGTLLVDRRGIVRQFTLSVTRSGERRTLRRYRIRSVGSVRLADPDWRGVVRNVSVSEGDSFLRYEHTATGLVAHVRGPAENLGSVRTREPSPLFSNDLLNRSRVSPVVGLVSTSDTATQRIEFAYDERAIPPNGTESELALFAYDDSLQTFIPMNTSIDTASNVAVGNETTTLTVTHQNGTQRIVRGSVDPVDTPYLVVLHVPTWLSAF